MIEQHFFLDKYGWDTWVFYSATIKDYGRIAGRLEGIGCKDVRQTLRHLGELNSGLTYSRNNKSVVIIGRTTSADEFQDTFDHEKGHLARHISQVLRLNPYGEEAQYLAGEIGKRMFAVAKHFLCEHCRRQLSL